MTPDIDSGYPVSRAQIDSFRTNGFIKLKNVLSPESVDHYGREITRLTIAGSDRVRELVMSKRLGRIAAEILEVDGVRLYHDQSLWYLRRQGRAGRASSRLGCQARCMALSCLAPMTGRSAAACGELERRWPRLTEVTGNRAMPGFTAPKLLWLAENEPAIFAACRRVLLPKDYVRLLMTGDAASDMSDSAGTLWLDVGRRAWSDEALAATGLNRAHMPSLYEGTEPTGRLRTRVAQLWGLSGRPIVAAGAGDNAAGAVGMGAIESGAAFASPGSPGSSDPLSRRCSMNLPANPPRRSASTSCRT